MTNVEDQSETELEEYESCPDLTRVVLVLGNYFSVEYKLNELLILLAKTEQFHPSIIVLDGEDWLKCPLIQLFKMKHPKVKVIFAPLSDHPADLINAALPEVETEFVTFVWPGVPACFRGWSGAVKELQKKASASICFTHFTPNYQAFPDACYGHIQCQPCFYLFGAVIRTNELRKIGGADPNPIFQKFVAWDMFLRLSHKHDVCFYGCRRFTGDKDWINYPFIKPYAADLDLIHRCIVKPDRYFRRDGQPVSVLSGVDVQDAAYIDSIKRCKKVEVHSNRPVNVTVTGGLWEPAHNQLCFYNYFETERGRKRFNWRPLNDFEVVPDRDLEGTELLIVSRGRCDNVRRIFDWAERKNVPVLYMIDDNWFTVAEDWPVYKDLFSPGKPDYNVFVESLKRSTAVVVYNPILREYVSRYARKTFLQKINIDLKLFTSTNSPKVPGQFVVGYSGSPRYTNAAFTALAEFVLKRQDVHLLYFGSNLPEALESVVSQKRGIHAPYTRAYALYAQQSVAANADVLLAPLDNCVSSKSKCFNKYLEITASGAVGIYSHTSPYIEVVTHGKNGLIVPPEGNDKPEYWIEAIERLYADRRLLEEMKRNAATDVSRNYETNVRYADFEAMIDELLAGSRPVS